MSQPLSQQHALTAHQLNAIRAVIERNHAHFVNRYMMHAGCMWPDELMKEIEEALSDTCATVANNDQMGTSNISPHTSKA